MVMRGWFRPNCAFQAPKYGQAPVTFVLVHLPMTYQGGVWLFMSNAKCKENGRESYSIYGLCRHAGRETYALKGHFGHIHLHALFWSWPHPKNISVMQHH